MDDDLSDILKDDELREEFGDYMESSVPGGSNYLSFWIDCEIYTTLSEAKRKEEAVRILGQNNRKYLTLQICTPRRTKE